MKAQQRQQILTAYLTENGVTLGQESIYEKTNEIPTFQEMLESLDVEGKVITADAMHCQNFGIFIPAIGEMGIIPSSTAISKNERRCL